MTASHRTRIIDDYLAHLEAEAASLPRTERRELVEGIHQHIDEVLAETGDESDAAVLNLLDRIGDPEVLVQEERERLGLVRGEPRRVGLLEVGALVLTPLLWPVGVILLWASNGWNVRDKLIGTLVPPGGLFTSMMVFFISAVGSVRVCSSSGAAAHCSGGPSGVTAVLAFVLLLLVVFSPILTGVYMAIRLRQGTGAYGLAA
jgi:hypothetical protein